MSCILLPCADTGDFSDGLIVTENALAEVPPTNSRLTLTDLIASEPMN